MQSAQPSGGNSLTCLNMQLDTYRDESRPVFIAVISCVTSLLGVTLGSLTGSALLEHWEASDCFNGSFDRYRSPVALAGMLGLLAVVSLVPKLSDNSTASSIGLAP